MHSRAFKTGAALVIFCLTLSGGNLFAVDATTVPAGGGRRLSQAMAGRDAQSAPEKKKKSTREKKKQRLQDEKKAKEDATNAEKSSPEEKK